MTISEMIWKLINEIEKGKGNYDPVTLSEQIISLSVLYANLTSHIADMEVKYQQKLGEELDKDFDKPTNKIEMIAKRSDEYRDLKKAQALSTAVVQIIRASNKFIKLKQNEQEVSRYSGL